MDWGSKIFLPLIFLPNCLGGEDPRHRRFYRKERKERRGWLCLSAVFAFYAVKMLGWLGTQTHGLQRRGELFHALPRLDFRF
jgi:hypothetical protein